ncbi:hypothetical protein Tco_1180381 [Tanacetum coccineum]
MAPQGCVGFGLSPRVAFGFKMAAKGVVGLAVISAEGCRVWDSGFRACLAVETAREGVGLAVGQPGIAGKGRRVWLSLTAGYSREGSSGLAVVNSRPRVRLVVMTATTKKVCLAAGFITHRGCLFCGITAGKGCWVS